MNTGESRWDAPVVYLREYPGHDISPRGVPYFICAHCGSALQAIPGSRELGVMFVCVYSCGQRYWVDIDDED